MLRSPVPFLPRQREGDTLLPWVIGVMMFLSGLALAFSLSLQRGLDDWADSSRFQLSVQVVHPDPIVRAADAASVLRALKATPSVARAEIAAEAEVLELIAPWLGNLTSAANLPVPTLITVELVPEGGTDIVALAARVRDISENARLDDHKAWLEDLYDIARWAQVTLLGVISITALSTAAIVIFGCRAGLATHRESIHIMHLMGAEDSTIAQAFDRRYLLHGLIGGIGGVLVALLVLVVFGFLVRDLGQGLLSSVSPDGGTLLWLALLPVFAAGLSLGTARFTVHRALHTMT